MTIRPADLPKPDEIEIAIYLIDQVVTTGKPYGHGLTLSRTEKYPPKRLNFILEKWYRKKYWEIGTFTLGGWFTDEGRAWAMSLKAMVEKPNGG